MLKHFYIRFIIIVCIIFTFLSCSSPRHEHKRTNTFLTRISESGLKHFELRSGSKRQGNDNANGKQGQRGGGRQDERRPQNSNKAFEKSLSKMRKTAEELIETNGYCQTGFWVLDFDIDTRGQFLRGECNELASEADQAKFPDTIKNW